MITFTLTLTHESHHCRGVEFRADRSGTGESILPLSPRFIIEQCRDKILYHSYYLRSFGTKVDGPNVSDSQVTSPLPHAHTIPCNMSTRTTIPHLLRFSRTARFQFRRPINRRFQSTGAPIPQPAESMFSRLWNSPVGMKTVHFW